MIIILTIILVSKFTTLTNLPSNNNCINLKDSSPNTSCFVKTIRSKSFESLSSMIVILCKKGQWIKCSCQWTSCKYQKNVMKTVWTGLWNSSNRFFWIQKYPLKNLLYYFESCPKFWEKILLFLQHTARNIFHTFKINHLLMQFNLWLVLCVFCVTGQVKLSVLLKYLHPSQRF